MPQAAIIEMGLPDIDGLELSRRIGQAAPVPRPVLVAITGFGQHEDKDRLRQAGFDVHLTRPVDPAALAKVLHRADSYGPGTAFV